MPRGAKLYFAALSKGFRPSSRVTSSDGSEECWIRETWKQWPRAKRLAKSDGPARERLEDATAERDDELHAQLITTRTDPLPRSESVV